MKKGRICFNWNGKVVGQVSPVDGNVFAPFVPFKDEEPKEAKFLFAHLENKLDAEMLKRLREDGVRWIAFSLDKYLEG